MDEKTINLISCITAVAALFMSGYAVYSVNNIKQSARGKGQNISGDGNKQAGRDIH